MMRGVSTWAVAVRVPTRRAARRRPPDRPRRGRARRDRGPELPARLGAQAPPLAALADHPRRRRARRVAADRLPGAEHLGQRAAARGRGADLARHLDRHDRARAGAGDRPVLPAAGRHSRASSATAAQLGRLRHRREAHPDHDLPRLPVGGLADEGPAARLRVPRRRAQDDLLLRGRPAADARERAALQPPAPALRHELPAHRDDRRDRSSSRRSARPRGTGCSISRVVGIPLVAGLAFEVIKWFGRNRTKRWARDRSCCPA